MAAPRPKGCCGRCCACCLCIAYAFPEWFYFTLFILFNLATLGTGGFLIMFGVNFLHSGTGPLVPKETVYITIVVGAFLALLALYGCIAPCLCRGDRKDQLKYFYVACIPILLTTVVCMIVFLLNANDAENINSMLSYGWQRSFNTADRKMSAVTVQTQVPCCGFDRVDDRPALPCPAASGALVGCAPALQSALAAQLGIAGIIFGGVSAGILLLMGITHGWVEKMAKEELAISSRAGATRDMGQMYADKKRAMDKKTPGEVRQSRDDPRSLPPQTMKGVGGIAGLNAERGKHQ